jgi:hypothetical protein
MSKTRILVLKESDEEVIVVVDYGDGTACMCSTYLNGGTGCLTTEYWQERFTKEFRNMKALYEHLSGGKLYLTDWNGKSDEDEFPFKEGVDEEVIDEAIEWLLFPPGEIEKTIKSYDNKEYKDTSYEIRAFLDNRSNT